MTVLPLRDVAQEQSFGGKATQLGAALRAGFPVPSGVALSVELARAVARGEAAAVAECQRARSMVGSACVAVRSSAVGEDGERASFAGQHLTRLGVTHEAALVAAVRQVWQSGRSEAAIAYRARLGVSGEPQIAVVVQQMIDAECAGVMFTAHPVDGRDERVIEAAWGLGEAVVAGLVEPDRWRLARGGEVIEKSVGDKDVAVRLAPGGDTEQVAVPAAQRRAACLDARRLRMLEGLAARCESVFAGAHDIEWAFEGDRLFLLQRRAVTR